MKLVGTALVPGEVEGVFCQEVGAAQVPARAVTWSPSARVEQLLRLERAGWSACLTRDPRLIDDAAVVPPPRMPVVGGMDGDLFRPGDHIKVNGSGGTVDLPSIREVRVVTSFLEDVTGRILLLRRSSRVGSFQGRWAGVSGFLEDPTPEGQARREIREETGFTDEALELLTSGSPIFARDGDRVFVVYPFRFRVLRGEVRLDWEHTEYAWVRPEEIVARATVPKLLEAWHAVAP